MSTHRTGLTDGLLNAALLILGLGAAVLIYALVVRSVSPRVDPKRENNPAALVGDIIQVEVRNGCGISGLAAEMTQFLRQRGFDVVEVGDYESFDQAHSLVIDRVGDLENARKLALVLGISEDHVQQDIRLDYYLDASVIIGRDFATLHPFEEP